MRQSKTKVAKIAKVNHRIRKQNKEAWERMANSKRYKCFLAKQNSMQATDDIKDEVYNGIFLELSEHNRDKSINVQKRILRRIVEKRQAKASFHAVGHSSDLLLARVTTKATSRCFARLRKQNCFAA